MATHGGASHGDDYTRGEMIIEEHEKTYSGFLKMTKWGSLYLAALLVLPVQNHSTSSTSRAAR